MKKLIQDEHYIKYKLPVIEEINRIPEFFNLLKIFNKRELDITMDYFLTGMTLKEVGKKYGLTPERIRQITSKTVRKIMSLIRRWEIKKRLDNKTKKV